MTPPAAAFFWSDAAVARLRALWGEGRSASQIARVLGTTRNAVIGKAHRLALKARPSPIVRRQVAPDAPCGGCLFPMWNHQERPTHVYCGEPRENGPYCQTHYALTHQPGTAMDAMEAERKRSYRAKRSGVMLRAVGRT